MFTRESKNSEKLFKPKLLSLLRNMFLIPNPNSIDSDSKFDLLNSSTILRIRPVSLIWDGNSLVNQIKLFRQI